MPVGWEEEKEKTETHKRIRLELGQKENSTAFWDTLPAPSSPICSELNLDLETNYKVQTLKVLGIRREIDHTVIIGNNKNTVKLYGNWENCNISVGNSITVMQCFCCNHQNIPERQRLDVVTDTANYLIVHSNKSQTVTNILRGLECKRKAFISEQVERIELTMRKPQVLGIVIHDWFDFLARNKDKTVSIQKAAEELKQILIKNIINLYRIDQKLEESFREIFRYIGVLKEFIAAQEYKECKESKTVHSPMLQIKGKPDLIVLTEDGKESQIELKTGARIYMDNIAQTILYGLLQQEQQGYSKQSIYHLPGNRLHPVEIDHKKITDLLIHRNNLVSQKRMPPRKEISACERCDVKDICKDISLFEAPITDVSTSTPTNDVIDTNISNKNESSVPMDIIQVSQEPGTSKVDQIDKETKPDREYKEDTDTVSDTVSSIPDLQKRDKTSTSKIDTDPSKIGMTLLENMNLSDIRLYKYLWEEIQKEEDSNIEPLLCGKIHLWDNYHLKLLLFETAGRLFYAGDWVTIYDTNQCAICKGIIRVIQLDGLIEIQMKENIYYKYTDTIYISKCPNAKSMGEYRASIILLFRSQKIQRLWTAIPKLTAGEVPEAYRKEFEALNADQQKALVHSLNPSPYTLVHGMPGTGKTLLIALLIRILVYLGKRVLVCCYTHLSISNIEERLKGHHNIRIYKTSSTDVTKGYTNTEGIQERLDSYNVVMSTTRAVFTNVIFDRYKKECLENEESNHVFDVCVVDEASQQNFLHSVIPSLISKAFIFVGDHLQLQPFANVPVFKKSLFDLLRTRSSLNSLCMQYRMPYCIMALSNQLFYNNQMVCMSNVPGKLSIIDITSSSALMQIIKHADTNTQVLCYFNEQVRYIRQAHKRVETIDRFQGSEAQDVIVVVDTLISSPDNEILHTPQRLNVALTRSKSTLTVLGSVSNLSHIPVFKRLFSIVPPQEYYSPVGV
ncbi:DNA replication ATP-dependent helicase/nuclease Dna2 [Nematocida sp. AWRm80]|nr:DNA replication ATP-dependent helicase/nuclease Dna2 [Nematocida sp. AWRm80]